MSFLNSKTWREFQRSVGREIFEINKDVYLIKMELPLGKNYLYSPSPRALDYLDEIKKIGQKQGSIFFKFEPLTQRTTQPSHEATAGTANKEQLTRLQNLGFRDAVKELQPQRTIILDLNVHHDELLGHMHKKTSYNIRLSEKKFLKVENSKDINAFWDLLKKTSNRSEFAVHPKEYYKKLIELENVDLYFVKTRDQFAAAAIVISYNNRMTYLHGASDYSLRKYMAPYFLHWELIKIAGREDMDEYDLWGIDEKRWPGVTRFKRGFGGKEVQYIGSFDLVFKPVWYWAYKFKNKF
ncbi:MAG: hypothetical protein A3A00_02080 [Candidatus Spechtbacteria bacterium RIFCSPLOWO2_01_FULL_38_20]|nr:MAG: hypothetical protein A3A00_02080 [Candidatus Spechtbacteria bacterium RIFCSPLOWO2_01_FULL_38_20]